MFHVNEFLNSLKENRYSSKTIRAYSSLLAHFSTNFLDQGILHESMLTEQMITEYVQSLGIKRQSGKTYYIKVRRLIKFLDFLEEKDYIYLSPLRDFGAIKYSSKSYPSVRPRRMEKILQSIKKNTPLCIKGRTLIELAYSSALRPRELYNLRVSDIDYKRGFIYIHQSKNGKDRLVPTGTTAMMWLRKYCNDVRPKYLKGKTHSYVFINHKTGEKLTVWGIRYAIHETLRINGFRPIKTYSLRSAAATALLLNGMDVAYISRLLGHSDIRTTQIYLKIQPNDLVEKIGKKHPRAKFKKYITIHEEEKDDIRANSS